SPSSRSGGRADPESAPFPESALFFHTPAGDCGKPGGRAAAKTPPPPAQPQTAKDPRQLADTGRRQNAPTPPTTADNKRPPTPGEAPSLRRRAGGFLSVWLISGLPGPAAPAPRAGSPAGRPRRCGSSPG